MVFAFFQFCMKYAWKSFAYYDDQNRNALLKFVVCFLCYFQSTDFLVKSVKEVGGSTIEDISN